MACARGCAAICFNELILLLLGVVMDMASLPADLQHAVDFHGHICPGVLIGWRLVQAIQQELDLQKAEDEELVAVAENNSCSVDAFQALLSTTFGKGNLKWSDYGKQAFTVYDRKRSKAVRALFTGDKLKSMLPDGTMDRQAFMRALLTAPDADVVSLADVPFEPPEMAKIEMSLVCARCGELVQQSRSLHQNDKTLCKPCAAQEGLL